MGWWMSIIRKGMQCGQVESEKVVCHPVDFFTCYHLNANVAKAPKSPCCNMSV